MVDFAQKFIRVHPTITRFNIKKTTSLSSSSDGLVTVKDFYLIGFLDTFKKSSFIDRLDHLIQINRKLGGRFRRIITPARILNIPDSNIFFFFFKIN